MQNGKIRRLQEFSGVLFIDEDAHVFSCVLEIFVEVLQKNEINSFWNNRRDLNA